MALKLSRDDARRLAVRAQQLTASRPTDLMTCLRGLPYVQHDPVSAVAPSADLVLWSRLGPSYDPAELRDALDSLEVVDLLGLVRPAEDVRLHRAEMARWPGPEPWKPWEHELVAWVEANDGCRRDILDALRSDGPLPESAFEDTGEVPWRSSGWNNDKNVKMLLSQLVQRGEVATAGREGREKLYDLASRIYPDDDVPSADEALALLDAQRLRSLGIARAKSAKVPGEPNGVGAAGEAAVVEGVKGSWQVEASLLDESFAGRAALLSPLDRLVYDRKRLLELFEYEYYLEMYKPVASRRWGYYALPVLHGDRFVGKLDCTSERAEGVLRVDALHWDVSPTPAVEDDVHAEVDSLATWLGLEAYWVADSRG